MPSPKRARQTADRARRRAETQAAAAARQEARDEGIAPAVQRRAVTRDGAVIRAPLVTRSTVGFVRSNPVSHLVARGVSASLRGNVPPITPDHERAAKRLALAWEEGGRGVGMGASDYSRQHAPQGRVPQGIAEGVLRALNAQIAQRQVYDGALAWLGALTPIVRRVVIEGADVATYARETKQRPEVVVGYLSAALDMLVEYFAAVDRAEERKPARR